MKNKVKQIRTRQGLSQKQLAKAARTSQQQIQRIETHKTAPRLQLAIAISKGLQQPLDIVFPGTGKAMKEVESELATGYLPGAETYEKALAAGIEADPRIWYLKILLRGHKGEFIFRITPGEYRRLFRAVQNEGATGTSFVVFDTDSHRLALNLRELVYCHFLFEAGHVLASDDKTDEEEDATVRIYFAGNDIAYDFGAEEDRGGPGDEEDLGQFRDIFSTLETFVEDHDRLHFDDEDGEDVFFRVGDLALLQVPLWVVEPDALDERLRNAEEADEEEEQAD